MDTLKRNSAKGYKDDEGIGTSLWEGCELGPFSPGKRRLWGRILLVCINTWREGDKEDRAKIFSVVPSYGTKLKHRRFLPKIRKHFQFWGWPNTGAGYSERLWSFPSLKIFRRHLDTPLCGPAWAGAGWIRHCSESFATPTILWFSDKPWQCTSFRDPASILRFPISLKTSKTPSPLHTYIS